MKMAIRVQSGLGSNLMNLLSLDKFEFGQHSSQFSWLYSQWFVYMSHAAFGKPIVSRARKSK